MSIFNTEVEALEFLSALGMGIYRDCDPAANYGHCCYWYIAQGGHDGRMVYKSLNHQDCIDWVNIRAEESLLWADELRALGKAP